MYMGSHDLRELERFKAKKDFCNFKMEENEEVGSYQARFEKITARLTAHGIKEEGIPQSEKILIIIDGLPTRHKMTKAILNETVDTHEMTFHEIFGKIQKYDDEEKKGKTDPTKGMALMIERAVELVVNDEDENSPSVDPQTALLTRGMRNMLQRRSKMKKDVKDIECYNCQKGITPQTALRNGEKNPKAPPKGTAKDTLLEVERLVLPSGVMEVTLKEMNQSHGATTCVIWHWGKKTLMFPSTKLR